MKNARGRIVGLSLAFAAISCGGSKENPGTPDASGTMADASQLPDASPDATPDAPARVCGSITGGMLDIFAQDASFIGWEGPTTTDLTTTNRLIYRYEFYSGIEPSLTGTFDLAAGNQSNYKTCAICVRAFELDANDQVVRQFYQFGGSITLTQDPITTKHVIGTVTNLKLQEVTVDSSTYTSTPVPNGACGSFPASFMVDRDHVPSAWTCANAAYEDGATCNCMCGVSDPDCSIASAPVQGCTGATDVCVEDACVTPPANDTCATAATLTLGTPVTGTTTSAGMNYDDGLQTCTGYMQAGPDVAYSVMLAASQQITVTLSNLSSGYDGSVSLVGPGMPAVCDAVPIVCLEGADANVSGMDETFMFTTTAAGVYYVIVDGYGTSNGTFTLTVTSP